jgi:hypothetical protein
MSWQPYLMLVPPALLGLARVVTWVMRARGHGDEKRPGYIELRKRS